MAVILFIFIIFPCHCAVYTYKIMILQKPLSQFPPNFALILLLKCDWQFIQMIMLHWLSGPYILLRTAQMMIFSLVAMIGLEKCCITSAYLQWLCHSCERVVALGPLVHLWKYHFYTPDCIKRIMLRGMASVRKLFSFPANSSYSLHPMKLKLGILLDHDVAQGILFRGYSPPNVWRVMPLRKFL